MDIPGIKTSLDIALPAKSPQAVVDAWKVGQLLNASVVSASQNGQATVNINGTLLLAQTTIALRPGQTLQLEVTAPPTMTVLKALANTPGATPPMTLTLPPQPQLLAMLQSRQTLSGQLIPTPEAPRQPSALLELAGQRLQVQLSQALPSPARQAVRLEVINPGSIARLKILTTPSSPADIRQAAISQALRNTLPQQTPLPPLLTQLAQLAKLDTASMAPTDPSQARPGPPMPRPFIEQVRKVLEGLPRATTLSNADGLKQAVAQSGLFLEARLAQSLQQPNPTAPTPDFKSGLLGLLLGLLNLRPTPAPTAAGNPPPPASPAHPQTHPPGHAPAQTAGQTPASSPQLQLALTDLLRTLEGGLARIQLSQLLTSAAEDDGKRGWVIELPVRAGDNIDLIQLRIDKDTDRKAAKRTDRWTVNLALSLSGLGPLQANVSLANKIVHTHFWSENPQTTKLIDEHLDMLHKGYQQAGLTVGTLKAHHGTAPAHPAPEANLTHILVDEKA